MFCSSDSARNLLKTCVIPFGVSNSRLRAFIRGMVCSRTGKVLCHGSGTPGILLKCKILPLTRNFLLFSDFVLRLNLSSRKMAKLENLSVCRDEHTTRCLDRRFYRLSGTAPEWHPVPHGIS